MIVLEVRKVVSQGKFLEIVLFSYFISRFDKFHAVISCNRKPFVQETPAVFSFGGCSHLLKEVLLNDRTSAIEPVLLLLTT